MTISRKYNITHIANPEDYAAKTHEISWDSLAWKVHSPPSHLEQAEAHGFLSRSFFRNYVFQGELISHSTGSCLL